MTPNREDIVQAVAREFPHLLQRNTSATVGEFTRRVVLRLNPSADPRGFGMLTKTPGEHHVVIEGARYAADAIIYGETQQVIDIVGNAEAATSPGRPAWTEVTKRPSNAWAPPIPFGSAPPDTPLPPSPDLDEIRRRLDAQQAQIQALQAELKKRVALRSTHGRYLCAEPDGRVVADREHKGAWELFEVER